MLVVRRVELTFFGARKTGHGTGLDHFADQTEIRRRLSDHDPSGRVARIGAVEAEPNAANELRQVALGQAGVCAGRAAGQTVETFVDTAEESGFVEAARVWMHGDDLLIRHALLLVGWLVR